MRASDSFLNNSLESINCVAISPDNKFFATAGNDKTIKIWIAKSGVVHKQAIKAHHGIQNPKILRVIYRRHKISHF